jgi:hypothetical protein
VRPLLSVFLFAVYVASCSAQIVSVRGSGHVSNASTTEPAPKPANPADALTDRDVVDLVAMGLPDDIVIQRIQAAPVTKFDLSVAGLKSLKNGKVSDAVIRTVLNPKAPATGIAVATASTSELNGLPQSVGVFVRQKNGYLEIEPEIVGWQTGGVLKSTATLGLDKGHVNGKVSGPRSATRLSNPLEIIVRTLEGTSATEFQLLKLYQKSDRREFRSITGGVFHATGGADRTRLLMTPEKIADRTWRIKLDRLASGEYGLLPPGISSASIGASGKIFTFTVLE